MSNDLETQNLRDKGVSAIMSRFRMSEDDLVFAGRMSLLGEKEQVSRVESPKDGFNTYHVYFEMMVTQTDEQILNLLGEVGLKNPTSTSRRGNITTLGFGKYSLYACANRDSSS